MFYSKTLKNVLSKVPGKRLGIYRFLPIFFFAGALLEYTMINWRAFGHVNFYDVYKKRQVRTLAEEALLKEQRGY